MKALIRDNVAVNVVADDALATSFHPDTAALFVTVPDNVKVGWRKVGTTWQAPPDVPTAPTYPPEAYVVDVPAFKMRFTPQQLVAIRASSDTTVKAFLAEVLDDPRTVAVNLALPFVKGAVEYLVTLNLITQADADRILAPQ